jgi:ferric-dicitrate binding protein FerR (iron transport regulator)
MALGCARAGRLSLVALAEQATMAERLELEAHLAACARCHAEHAALADLRRLRQIEPDALGAVARERVRAAVLARPARVEAPARPLRRLFWPLGAGAALAAAAASALWLSARTPAGPRVLGGDVVAEDVAGPGGPGAGVALRSARSGEVQLGDARASLARATEIVWRRERRRVDLRAGTATFDVDHRPGQSFEVWTPRFVVDVVGTRFSVDLGGVRTERGLVRVLSVDGELIAHVAAGQAWSVPAPSPLGSEPRRGSEPGPVPPPPPEAPPAATVPAIPKAQLAGGGDGVAALASARASLARGDAAAARRTLEPLFRMGRSVAPEARALYAESYLIEGRYPDAEASYRALVGDYPRAPQAESALYAIAQLASEHGQTADARDAVARYLARYPRGRFAKEAAALAARLAPAR